MNLFVVDRNIAACAQAHVDTHVVKMPTEHFQMISFSLRAALGDKSSKFLLLPGERVGVQDGKLNILDETLVCARFNKAHYNHPCTIWGRQSQDNIEYMVELTIELEIEWRHRYGHLQSKQHESVRRLWELYQSDLFGRFMDTLPKSGLTDFAQCMPDHFRKPDAVEAYREFYRQDKSHLHKWTNRQQPDWI